MEWVIAIVALFAISLLTGGEKTLGKRTAVAKAIAVKDFIEAGRVYTVEEAEEVIRRFVEALGDSKGYRWVERADELSQSFPRLLTNLKETYEADAEEQAKEIDQSRAHYEQVIQAALSDPKLDDEDRKSEACFAYENLEDEVKEAQKLINWYEKQVSSLDENPTPVLKKVLTLLKREHREDNPPPDFAVDHWDEFLKEPPY